MVEYSREQFEKDFKRDFNREAVAAGVGLGSAIASIWFPPAIWGVLVGGEEAFRNAMKIPLRAIKYGIPPKNIKK